MVRQLAETPLQLRNGVRPKCQCRHYLNFVVMDCICSTALAAASPRPDGAAPKGREIFLALPAGPWSSR
jgi:hypothetical protein